MPREVPQYIQQLSTGSAPEVQFTRAGANATQNLSGQLTQLGANMHAKDVEIQKIQAKNSLDTNLKRMYEAHKNDPAALKGAHDKFKGGFIKGIKSPELAQLFELNYEAQSAPFFDQAVTNKSRLQEEEHELVLRTAIDSAIDSSASYVSGVASSVPEHVFNAERALGGNKIAFDELLQARRADGAFMFSPAQQVAFSNQRDGGILARVNADMKLKTDDPAAWGALHGLNTQQIIGMQTGAQTPSVLGKKAAKETVGAIKAASNVDEIVALSQQMKSRYGEFSYNAMLDLKRAGLPPEKEAIMQMAADDPQGNIANIQILNDLSGVGNKELKELYEGVAFDGGFSSGTAKAADIEVMVTEEMGDSIAAMVTEGRDFEEINAELSLTNRLAKGIRIKNPAMSDEEAAKQANSYVANKYKSAGLNGIKYRVPVRYDVDQVEERLEEKMPEMDIVAGALDREIEKISARSIKEIAVPFLNSKGDALRFRSPNGEILLNSAGDIAEITFDDIIATETPRERRDRKVKQIESLPFGEREAARKKAFPR